MNLLAPFSVGVKNNATDIIKNIVNAQDTWDGTVNGYQTAFPNSSLIATNSVFIPDLGGDISKDSANVALTMRIDTGVPKGTPSLNNWLHVKPEASKLSSVISGLTWGLAGTSYRVFNKNNTFVLKIVESGTNNTGYIDITEFTLNGFFDKRWTDSSEEGMVNAIVNDISFTKITSSGKAGGLTFFKPGTNYDIGLYYYSSVLYEIDPPPTAGPETIPGLEDNGQTYFKIASTSVLTASKEKPYSGKVVQTGKQVIAGSSSSPLPACSIDPITHGTFMGCVAQGFYYILFQPTSYLFALAGTFFDYAFSYSVQDSSYRSSFVVEGWGLVRDFCNMFFIFIMLYVAIGTILSLHSMKTKETIINVVIIGLFINFSLFATQLIIDAANVTARVFYNSDAIKITEKAPTGATEVVSKIPTNGAIPLSAALVNKINPQSLIINAREINKIPNNSTDGLSDVTVSSGDDIGIGQFILIVILAAAINIVGFLVFAIIGFLFVARVVGLWTAMILAPVAFFTYILPEMSSIETIGWKKWWPNTIKLAFLAPVFIFFMYIILKFLQLDLISDAAGKSGLDFLIATIIPFVFVVVLLLKAKKIAVDMSGEFGEMAVKASGLALGAATGGAAFMGRATLGRIGNSIANSSTLAKAEAKGGVSGYLAKMALKSGDKLGGASFDARNTKLGGIATSGVGVNLGKGKAGGYKADVTNREAARTKRVAELKSIVTKDLEKEKRAIEAQKKLVEDNAHEEIAKIDKDLEIARQNQKDTSDPAEKKEIEGKISKLKAQKALIESGGIMMNKDENGNPTTPKKNSDGTDKYHTDNGHITEDAHNEIKAEAEKNNSAVITAKAEEKTAIENKEATIEAAKEANKQIYVDAENKAKAEGETIRANAQNQINAMLAEAQKAEIEAITAFSTASANAAKNPSDDNTATLARAQEIRDAAMINTEKIKSNAAQIEGNAGVAAEKLLKEAREKAAKEVDEANKKAEEEAEKFVESATKAREEAEKQADISSKKLASANESAEKTKGPDGKIRYGKSIKKLGGEVKEKENEIHHEQNHVAKDYSDKLGSRTNRIMNVFAPSNLQDTRNKIILGMETKKVDGASNSGGGHAPAEHKTEHKAEHKEEHKADDHGGGGHDAHHK